MNLMIFIIILLYSALGIFEFVPLYKEKLWYELVINTVLFSLSFIIAVLLVFGIKPPSPAVPIERFIISIFGE
jgi:hypothetical protein